MPTLNALKLPLAVMVPVLGSRPAPVTIPDTERVPMVERPATNECPSGLKVIPDPTFIFPLTVVIPVANIFPSGLKVIPDPTFVMLFAVSVLVVSVVTIPVVAVKVVTIPVVAFKVAAVVMPAISTPVGDGEIVPTPDRLVILSTLISDAIWVHFPPNCFTI